MTENSSNKKAPAGKPGRALGITGYEPIIYKDYSNITPETIDPNLSEQEAAIKPQDAGPLSGALFTKLQPVQAAALDLYHRGINVFPLPSVWGLRRYAEIYGLEATKAPYDFIYEMYKYRLHVCGPDCERKYQKTGKRCMPEGQTFIELFYRHNIGAAMGWISNNLFCIDCDDHYLFEITTKQLDHRGINYWAYTGSKGGNILMRLLEGEAENKPGKGSGIEIWGHERYMILPPSVHIDGVFYQWITTEPNKLPPGEMPPLVELKQLEFLGVELAKNKNKSGKQWHEPELYGLPPEAARLSWPTRIFLGQGVQKGDRNNRIYAACRELKGWDIPYEKAETWILEAAAKCVPPFTRQDAIKRLKTAYGIDNTTPAIEHKTKDYKPTESAKANKLITRALELANIYHWKGSTAQSDKAVFIACCKRAAIEGKKFRAASREMAEQANTGRTAAYNALQRLSGQVPHSKTPKLLQLAEQYNTKTNTAGTKYSLNKHEINKLFETVRLNDSSYNWSTTVIKTHTPFNPNLPTTPAEQDLFGNTGIGRIAWYVWQLLIIDPQPNNKTRIAKLRGLDRTSVARAIDRLIKYGLIEYEPAENMLTGQPKTEAQLQEIAARLDGNKIRREHDRLANAIEFTHEVEIDPKAVRLVFGRSEKRKRYHDLERAKRLHKIIYFDCKDWDSKYAVLPDNTGQEGKEGQEGQP